MSNLHVTLSILSSYLSFLLPLSQKCFQAWSPLKRPVTDRPPIHFFADLIAIPLQQHCCIQKLLVNIHNFLKPCKTHINCIKESNSLIASIAVRKVWWVQVCITFTRKGQYLLSWLWDSLQSHDAISKLLVCYYKLNNKVL